MLYYHIYIEKYVFYIIFGLYIISFFTFLIYNVEHLCMFLDDAFLNVSGESSSNSPPPSPQGPSGGSSGGSPGGPHNTNHNSPAMGGGLQREDNSSNTLNDFIDRYFYREEDTSSSSNSPDKGETVRSTSNSANKPQLSSADNPSGSQGQTLPSTTYNPNTPQVSSADSSSAIEGVAKTTNLPKEDSSNSLTSQTSSTPSMNTLSRNYDEAVASGNINSTSKNITVKRDF